MRRSGRIAVAALALVAAAALVLVAQDVRRWPRALLAGDVQFAEAPFGANPWRPSDRVPFSPARRLLSVDDDLVFRRALQLYRQTAPDNPQAFTMSPDERATLFLASNRALSRVAAGDPEPARRSLALNLLALLAFQDPAPDEGGGFARSARLFADAVRADGSDEAAKRNLELYLRLVPSRPKRGTGGGGPRKRRVGESGAGLAPSGSGY